MLAATHGAQRPGAKAHLRRVIEPSRAEVLVCSFLPAPACMRCMLGVNSTSDLPLGASGRGSEPLTCESEAVVPLCADVGRRPTSPSDCNEEQMHTRHPRRGHRDAVTVPALQRAASGVQPSALK